MPPKSTGIPMFTMYTKTGEVLFTGNLETFTQTTYCSIEVAIGWDKIVHMKNHVKTKRLKKKYNKLYDQLKYRYFSRR